MSDLTDLQPPKSSVLAYALAVPLIAFALVIVGIPLFYGAVSPMLFVVYVACFGGVVLFMWPIRSPKGFVARQLATLIALWGMVILVLIEIVIFLAPNSPMHPPADELSSATKALVGNLLFWSIGAVVATWRMYGRIVRTMSMSELFSRYVPADVVMQMIRSKDDFFRTERRSITVLFADLRGFTHASSQLSADQVKQLINLFLGVMIPVAHRHRGTIDKTVGDEIMILFGAPLRYDDHQEQAVHTALELQKAHADVVKKWTAAGLPVLQMGIGVNTGEMVVGNIGCKERVDYTVLGHHVNLGARLCSAAKGGQILLSEFTKQGLSADFLRDHPLSETVAIEAKGIDAPVKAFAIATS